MRTIYVLSMGFGKDNTGVIIREIVDSGSLGALSARDVLLIPGGVTLVEDFRILKTDLFAIAVGVDSGEGEGLLLGMANGNLTAAEIEEAVEAQGPVGPSDRIGNERAMRQYHWLGEFRHIGAITDLSFVPMKNHGAAAQDRFRWTYTNTDGWTYFLYMNSPTGIATGWNVAFTASHYGVWLI